MERGLKGKVMFPTGWELLGVGVECGRGRKKTCQLFQETFWESQARGGTTSTKWLPTQVFREGGKKMP